MQNITILGNLGKDAEIKSFGQTEFVAFNVAVTERWKDAQGQQQEKTQWYSCLSRQTAGKPYLTKGKRVVVTGTLSASAKDGVAYLDIRNAQYEFAGGSSDSPQQPASRPAPNSVPTPSPSAAIPNWAAATATATAQAQAAPQLNDQNDGMPF